uniref:Photosystem I reaction center subunit VIII n=1 Tax=Cyanophora biloba TaxID=1489483 RepID=A0A2Z4HGH6_9EUKA|nr:photosystem I subunit VIII [Cyanophora biloba]AWW13899.1 photosystem I subunit VIII [Cyanophora biloba]
MVANLPTILVPIVGWLVPGLIMSFLFVYMETDEIA